MESDQWEKLRNTWIIWYHVFVLNVILLFRLNSFKKKRQHKTWPFVGKFLLKSS